MEYVCKRFIADGMTPEQVAKRMDVPIDYINKFIKKEIL